MAKLNIGDYGIAVNGLQDGAHGIEGDIVEEDKVDRVGVEAL